ncbi:MAG TPA: cupredoxin domain-containing protein [Anaerolineales bacterium]|nr:cupredoxin domain-containing protein [Anaerolineales bacterium]
MRSIRFTLSFILVILALLAAGCASGPEKVEYSIEMTDFAYTPNTLELKVGQEVTLHLTNKGALKHELMVGQNVIMENGVATGFEKDMFAGMEPTVVLGEEMDHDAGHDHAGGQFMVTVPENSGTADVTFVVTEEMVGEWEIACFLNGGSHFQQGMTGKITVSP